MNEYCSGLLQGRGRVLLSFGPDDLRSFILGNTCRSSGLRGLRGPGNRPLLRSLWCERERGLLFLLWGQSGSGGPVLPPLRNPEWLAVAVREPRANGLGNSRNRGRCTSPGRPLVGRGLPAGIGSRHGEFG